MTVMAYAQIEVHGTPAGFKAGCKTDAMCDPSAPWSCRRGYERARGDYAFNMRLKEGLSPAEIHELELGDAQRLAEEEAAWLAKEGMKAPRKSKPAKPATARKGSRLPLVDMAAGPVTRVAPDRLAAYGANADAAMARVAAAGTSLAELAELPAALAEATNPATPSKETPMTDTSALPTGLEWKQPSARALQSLARGSKTKNARAIEATKQNPGQWLSLGVQNASGMSRWRKGEVAGTKPGEFEALIDVAKPGDKTGELFIRYVGGTK